MATVSILKKKNTSCKSSELLFWCRWLDKTTAISFLKWNKNRPQSTAVWNLTNDKEGPYFFPVAHSNPSHGATTLVLLGTANARQEDVSPREGSPRCNDMCFGTSSCNCLLFRGLSPRVEDCLSCRRDRFGEVSLSTKNKVQ